MKRWEKGEPEAVWYETRRHCSDGGASGPAVKDPKAAETRAVRLAREGMFQKAHAALVSRELCTWSATVHDQLSALHPVGAPVRAAYRTGKHTEAEVEAVYRELRGFKTGSAGGLSGLTADHIDHRESRGTLRNLTAVCNVILAGEVPPAVHPFSAVWRPVWPTTTAQQEAFLQTPPPLLHSHRRPWPWTRCPIKAGSWTARPEWWRRTPSWTRFWPRRAERARPRRRMVPASSRRWVSGWTAVTLRKAAVDMLEQDDVLAGFAAAEGGAEYLARLRRPDGWGDSLSLEAICRAAGLSVWVLTVSEKGVPGLFRMGEEGWILAFLTQRPGHYDAFTVPEALQQAAKDGRLCLREGPLVAAEANGAATVAVDDSARSRLRSGLTCSRSSAVRRRRHGSGRRGAAGGTRRRVWTRRRSRPRMRRRSRRVLLTRSTPGRVRWSRTRW